MHALSELLKLLLHEGEFHCFSPQFGLKHFNLCTDSVLGNIRLNNDV